MPDNMDRVGIIAELMTAVAAVTYPIVRVLSRHAERRRQRQQRMIAAAAAPMEGRLMERYDGLEARVGQIERQREEAA
jgi:hypothetical protein